MKIRRTSKCGLCGETKEICKSHIIPKSIVSWYRETLPTGFFRIAQVPNLSKEDYIVIELLCQQCEDLFSVGEDYFKKNIFLPFQDEHKREFKYDARLEYFLTSISWRILIFLKIKKQLNHLTTNQKLRIYCVEKVWRKYLLHKRDDLGPYHAHIIVMGMFESAKGFDNPTPINQYLMGTIDINVMQTKSNCIVYSNLCGIIALGFIQKGPEWNQTNTRINNVGHHDGNYILDSSFAEYLHRRANLMKSEASKISEKQKEKIKERTLKNIGRVIGSRSMKARRADEDMNWE